MTGNTTPHISPSDIRSAGQIAAHPYHEVPASTEVLHPNLAIIAAKYDAIQQDFARGLITPQEAQARIRRLEARDDQGVTWVISPSDGRWYRRTVDGRLVPDTPPRSGIHTPSPFDVSQPNPDVANPYTRIQRGPAVDAAPVTARFVTPQEDVSYPKTGISWVVAAAVALLVLAAVVRFALG